jgi:UDP-N-acetylglucosamine 2-epimerase (non-hydrolysing)
MALSASRHEHFVVHSGQHYDPNMSDVFFEGLDLPAPTVNLEVGSSSHAVQTAETLRRLEPVLRDLDPSVVLVYGDTNTTLAGALACAKSSHFLAHVEAGLRSGNRSMPEEVNRVVTDHCADLLFAPTAEALGHLRAEGLGSRAVLTGDVMADVLLDVAASMPHERAKDHDPAYVVATLHRPANTDDHDRLRMLLHALSTLPIEVRLVAHPRLVAAADSAGLELSRGAIRVWEPQGYLDMIRLVQGSRGVVTDSGGLQKEAYLLGVPCTTLRAETEWPETLQGGWNVLAPDGDGLVELAARRVSEQRERPYGAGDAAQRIVAALETSQAGGGPL